MADIYAHISCFLPKTPHKGSTSGDQSTFSIDKGKVFTEKKWSMTLGSVIAFKAVINYNPILRQLEKV